MWRKPLQLSATSRLSHGLLLNRFLGGGTIVGRLVSGSTTSFKAVFVPLGGSYRRREIPGIRCFYSTGTMENLGLNLNGAGDGGSAAGRSMAERDFRSDTTTTPSPRQLLSVTTSSHGDDVYHESTTTTTFETSMATLFAKPAAIFVLSGTMGNQLSLRALLTQPPHSILCDHRAHILTSEAGGLAMFSQAQIQGVVPKNDKYLTLEDVVANATLSSDIHYCPTRVISLENTLGGNVMPLAEIQRIAAWAREKGVKMHLDGARLWNAVSVHDSLTTQTSLLKQYAAEFDTLTVCLSKSIGAPMGSVILSTAEIVGKVRHFRKAVGGGIRQAGILTAMAAEAVQEVFYEGRLKGTNEKAKRIEGFWKERCGGGVTQEVETNMVWLDLAGRGVSGEEFVEEAGKVGVKVFPWGRIVVHWQITDEAVDSLCVALEALAKRGDEKKAGAVDEPTIRGYPTK